MKLLVWTDAEEYIAGEDPEEFSGGTFRTLVRELLDEWVDEVIDENGPIHRDIQQATGLDSLIRVLNGHGFYATEGSDE